MNSISARDVRAFVRTRQRRPVSLLDRYVTVFMLVMAVAVFGNPVATAVSELAGQVDAARTGPGLALVLLTLAGFLAVGRAAGPVVLPAADASWLLLSRVDRRGLLGRPVKVLAAITLVVGALLGLAGLVVLGAPDQLVWRLLAAVVLGTSASAGGMALAVLGQGSQAWQTWLAVALTALLVVALLAATGVMRGPLAAVAAAPVQAVGAAAAGALVAASLLVRRAWLALDRIPSYTLMTAATRARHLTTAAAQLDPGALTWATEDNHWRARRLRSRPWPSLPAPLALAWQDWRRLARRPGRLALIAATTALPALLTQATGTTLIGGATPGQATSTVLIGGTASDQTTRSALIGSAASDPATGTTLIDGLASVQATGGTSIGSSASDQTTALTSAAAADQSTGGLIDAASDPSVGGLVPGVLMLAGALAVAANGVAGARRDAANPALARLAAVGPRAALLARALLPAVLAGTWMAAALGWLTAAGAAAGQWWMFGPLAAPALAAGALRMARRAPVDHSLPLLDTPMGAIPTGPVLWAVTGPDLALLGCLPAFAALAGGPADLSGYLAAQAVAGLAVLGAFTYRQK
ncbi:DUF6297 family protein [Nonomuraea sp. NPDC049649]|uniref:DUF6297 family protein n=1 Tax=Nonomuraea sp. NPDC049649 TaxID=3155776 RepID=UPI00341338AB